MDGWIFEYHVTTVPVNVKVRQDNTFVHSVCTSIGAFSIHALIMTA